MSEIADGVANLACITPVIPLWVEYLKALAPIAIIGSALLAALAAAMAVKHQRAIARRRATLDIILKLEGESYYQKSAATFRDLRNSKGLVPLLRPESQSDKEASLQVQSFLNHYELICCGIMEDTLDELFYFQYFRGGFVHHWHNSKEYVFKARDVHNNPRLFQRFELFATNWDTDCFVTRTKDRPSDYIRNHKKVSHKQG